MGRNAVIETSTGNVLRQGYCDFSSDGSFDGASETQLSDVPSSLKVYGEENQVSNWNGSTFSDIDSVSAARMHKNAEIDKRTVELINEGFTFNTKTFSLSTEAQIKWQGMKTGSDNGLLTYPVKITTIDDLEDSLADATAVNDFFAAGLSAVKGHLDSGRALKVDVANATTVAEVNAVVDNR